VCCEEQGIVANKTAIQASPHQAQPCWHHHNQAYDQGRKSRRHDGYLFVKSPTQCDCSVPPQRSSLVPNCCLQIVMDSAALHTVKQRM
jgi:hypothetical protein